MTRRPLVRSTILLAFLVPAAFGPLRSASAHTSPDHVVAGSARGEAVKLLVGPVDFGSNPDDVELSVSVGRATVQMESDGIGIGSRVAAAQGNPVRVQADPLAEADVAHSASSAPPGGTDTDGVPGVGPLPAPLNFFTASALNSSATTSAAPSGEATASIAEAAVTAPSPLTLDASILDGTAKSRRDGNAARSDGTSHVAKALVTIGSTSVEVVALAAEAHAATDGVLSTATTACTIAKIVISPGPTIAPVDCKTQPDIDLAPLPVKLEFGVTSESTSSHEANAAVDALRFRVNGTVELILGAARARAALLDAGRPLTCGDPLPKPTASGSADGTIARINDNVGGAPGVGQVDLVRSDARLDEAGLDGTDKGASADGWMVRGQVYGPPAEVGLIPSHAAAPPPAARTNYVLDTGPGSVSGEAAKTTASASTQAPSSLFGGHAAATAETATLDAVVSGLTVTDDTVTSSARTDRGAGVVSHGEADGETIHISGLPSAINPIVVHALHVTADASATGLPGGATAGVHFDFARVEIGSTVIDVPPPAPITIAGNTIEFGVTATAASADGSSASASIDAIRITTSTGSRIVVGHADASANAPALGTMITVDLDVHFDAPYTFGDSGGTAAPHQKVCKAIRVRNTTGSTLTGVVLTDTLNAELMTVKPLPPGLIEPTLNVVKTDPPFTLAPGEERSVTFLVEVKPSTRMGTVITNAATVTATGMSPVTSAPITINVGVVPTQPALYVVLVSQSFDSGTRILTANLRALNRPAAGKAFNVVIDQIDATKGVTVLTPPPVSLGNIEPGGFAPFTAKFRIPSGVTSFVAHFREVGYGSDGHRYAFDSRRKILK